MEFEEWDNAMDGVHGYRCLALPVPAQLFGTGPIKWCGLQSGLLLPFLFPFYLALILSAHTIFSSLQSPQHVPHRTTPFPFGRGLILPAFSWSNSNIFPLFWAL